MADTTIDLLKNSSYVGKMDELIAAVKLGGSATSDVEWNNVKNKPTTIGGYGITDAKIDNGTITLGNQTITPLTSAPVTSVNSKTGSVTLSAADVSAIPSTLTGTAGQVLTKTADGQEWKDVDIPDALPNPNALTFTGAVNGTYDGSAPLNVEIPSGGSVMGGCTFCLEAETTEEVSAVNWSLPINWGKIIQLNIYADVPRQDADLALYAYFGGTNYKSIGTLTAGVKNGIDIYILRTSSDFCTIGTAIVKSYPENAKPVMPTQVIYIQSGQNTLRLYSNTSGVNFPVGTKFVIWGVYVHENP